MRHKSSMLKVNFGGNTVGPIIAAIKKKKKKVNHIPKKCGVK